MHPNCSFPSLHSSASLLPHFPSLSDPLLPHFPSEKNRPPRDISRNYEML